MMADQFNPNQILLDNFLPNGQGIELLCELTLSGVTTMVFITTAYDIATVSEEVLRYGVFGYLIRPLDH